MTHIRHGLSIGIERINSDFFLSMKAIGKLTHQDYQQITPMLESAIQGVETPKVNLFFDASEFQGWEMRAAWDDFKLGMKHKKEFSKIAIYGNKKWLEVSTKIGNWFISGEIKYFDDSNQALTWLFESQSAD